MAVTDCDCVSRGGGDASLWRVLSPSLQPRVDQVSPQVRQVRQLKRRERTSSAPGHGARKLLGGEFETRAPARLQALGSLG